MAKTIDISGHTFGLLVVIARAPRKPGTVSRLSWYLCRCKCGREIVCRRDDLCVGRARRCAEDCPVALELKQSYVFRRTEITSRAGISVKVAKG
jgi:hypothetical protein